MLLSGDNFILTPKTQDMSFVFENVYVDAPGVAEVGFSGAGNKFFFLFSGGRLVDPNNNFVWTTDVGEPVTISGDFNASKHKYYIDNELISEGEDRAGFGVERFYANTTNCQVDMGLQMRCPPIPYEIILNQQFVAGSSLEGRVINHSPNIQFDILESEIIEPGSVKNFTGIVTGALPPQQTLNFELFDVSDSTSFPDADGTLRLKTTMGYIEKDITSTRTSGFFRNTTEISVTRALDTIAPYFSGSGNHEKFTWLSYPTQTQTYVLTYNVTNEDGAEVDKPLYVSLESSGSLVDQDIKTGQYIRSYLTYDTSGYYCTGTTEGMNDPMCAGQPSVRKDAGSGSYSGVPSLEFLTYRNVTGAAFNSNNIFSNDTPDKIPMLISGYSGEYGADAAGYFLTEPFQVNIGIAYGGDGINWRRITGYEMTNFGTGYTKLPAIYATTGIDGMLKDDQGQLTIPVQSGFTTATNPDGFGTGYDLAYQKNVFTYQKFEAYTDGEYLASYLTGIPYFVNTGNNVYGLSGILITNPGSGYDPTLYIPKIRAVRRPDDPLGTRGHCASYSQYTSEAACLNAGTCSDTQYNDDYEGCISAGTCSDPQYTTEQTCEDEEETWTSAGNSWTATPHSWYDHGDNLSGEFFFNKEGTTYDFDTAWNIETGWFLLGTRTGVDFREAGLIQGNKYSSLSWITKEEDQFYVTVKFDNLDIDEAMESKLVISGSGMVPIEYPISITNWTNVQTGLGYISSAAASSLAGTSFIQNYFGG